MEKWQVISIADLRAFEGKEKSIAGLESELAEAERRCAAMTDCYNSEPMSGTFLDAVVMREELTEQLRTVRFEVEKVRGVLSLLTADECAVLRGFYMVRSDRYIDRLAEELHMEKSSIYRLKDKALQKYALFAYGSTGY